MRDARVTEFVDLAVAFIEGRADQAQVAELNRLLAENADLRDLFVDLTMQPGLLGESLKEREPADGGQETANTAPAPRLARRTSNLLLPLAAAVLLSAAAVAIYVFVINPQSEIRDPNSSPPVATLIESTGVFVVDNDLANAGGEYPAGSYSIETGAAEFMLTNRVMVGFHGRTRLFVHDPMRTTLSEGSASFFCPTGTEGFTVNLPNGARVVDLGTRFHVDVDEDGAARVIVTEGEVEVHLPDGPRLMPAPYVATIGPDGRSVQMTRPVSADAHEPTDLWIASVAADRRAVNLGAGDRPAIVSDARITVESDPGAPSGTAFVLDGSPLDLRVPNHLPIEFSLVVWFKIEGEAGKERSLFVARPLVMADKPSAGDDFALAVYKDRLAFHDGSFSPDADKASTLGTTRVNDGRWHQAVVTRKPGHAVRLYLDGQPEAVGPAGKAELLDHPHIHIGANPGDERYLVGRIDHVAIYDRVLDPETIARLFHAGADPKQNDE